jgi:hypothetical protein
MKNRLLLALVASVAIALSSSCKSEMEEVTPVETVDVSKEKLADADGFVTKFFFPKDPINK